MGIETAIVGAAVGSSLIGGSAAKKSAKKQEQAADKAANLSQEQYYQTREDQMPFLEAGYGATNRLNQLLGIAPEVKPFTPQFDEAEYLRQNPEVAQAVATGLLPSGLAHYNKYGRKQGRVMYMTKAPVTGVAAQPADFGKYARDFGMSDFQADPGYAFRLSEGMKALDRQAAARGGLMSGGALKAAARYGQDMASDEYTNAFNRYQTNRAAQLNPLQSMAGMGQTTAAQLGNAGQTYAGQSGAAYGAAGQAQASGYMGAANAISGGLGQYLNYQSNNNLLAAINQRQAPRYGNVVAQDPNQYIG